MSIPLNLHDIQGNILRGYRSLGIARFLFFHIDDAAAGRAFIGRLAGRITPAAWGNRRPMASTNLALTHAGLSALGLPPESVASFPIEFRQGMRARAAELGDTGGSRPDQWDEPWRSSAVHLLLSCHSSAQQQLDNHCAALLGEVPAGVSLLDPAQDAARILLGGRPVEHFGFVDGLSNPAIQGMLRGNDRNLLGNPDGNGGFADIPAGEFILGYAGLGGEQRELPVPGVLGHNGTFMVFRKLAQDVAGFRTYLNRQSQMLSRVSRRQHDPAFLAAKMFGRWSNGSPLVLHPRQPAAGEPANDFDYVDDPEGALCPHGAHIRRTNPRSSLGLDGQLSMRRRMIRRGIPYGTFVPEQAEPDETPRGMLFIAFMSGIARQFEFVQRQWINSGDDFRQGNDKDPVVGDNDGSGRMVVPGDTRLGRPPFLCTGLPRFVTVKGGDYFFAPGLNGLRLLAEGQNPQG